VYQRLMQPKPNSSEVELDAASEVKQVSPTIIDFKLKPGQMFTDGFGEMTAEDVKFSFERIGLPPVAGAKESAYKGDWLYLVGVEVKGKYEGRITLSQPRANIYDVVIADGSGCIVSKKAVEQRGIEFGIKPVGSGQYQVVSLDKQKGAVLRRNPGYKGSRRGAFDEINVRVITDAKTADLALRAGELDFAILAPAAADPLRSVAGLTVSDQPSIAYVWMGMNMEKGPLADLRVRQAIRLGVDVDQMLLAGYNGKVPRLNTALPPQIMGHWREAPVYKRNVAEARSLLAAAGQSNLKLRLTILNQPEYQNMALVAKALLAEIGVTVDVDAQPGGTYWSSGKADVGKNLELYMSRFNAKHDPNFVLQWFTPGQIGEWNWSRWNSAEFDGLFKAAGSETDPAKRRVMVLDMQKAMDKTSAFVWLTNEASALVHKSWLKPASVPGWGDWQYADFSAS
ncbi:MAG: ABC transporter substrate-binding protein, partial [Rhodoferax sp.]|nr:ABC transporter substrate-binding protein [Rhodoferax sp.]